MKIISYNVNGLRAVLNKDFIKWLQAANPDVLLLQETKAQKEQLDVKVFEEAGYPYHYWFSAQKKGYSSVAILSKIKPNHVEYGTGIESMDFEGRNLRVDFDKVSLMSLYLPSGTSDDRLDFKLNYMAQFQDYINHLKKELPNLIIGGDFNICHEAIDIHNPVGLKDTSGFLPIERQWIHQFIESGFIDTFRYFNKEPHHYSWWSYRANARNNNKGWRIDYLMASESLKKRLKSAYILPEAKHSDHCPIVLELED
ncbi:MAG: exodeoxyribonuclease III [Flavobacteriales bacterium CG_4_9_14_0_2_um_filter_35_242]|nr:exodeoxyribonuclease III [Zetaproteobacteria bacterium]OIO12500.1 MAG: exodeoxyribonuclease III [Flavobacteriaceae bacterium CG1_02_35_72]PIV16561.1 MAG: exodeoxyribonuclease III [Flavobacteriales bacterium CG03_land_8_20_14_0_80_35_15]PIX07785.1 MAG: exodeoxyribonuclease III [Flavobacteriales bacterium CG_4_8_14_3_um_filter_35_10]PJA05044.1 MAG: exodeoxyribonuclease III [Flavobacteriales bacterium CG_4_10_14_0_2_um_filter_35_18]PJC60030.1 MAG: exodeoxyribonuclease III [Flavobacteriales bac